MNFTEFMLMATELNPSHQVMAETDKEQQIKCHYGHERCHYGMKMSADLSNIAFYCRSLHTFTTNTIGSVE